ncbi:DUF1173 family protein [Rhodoferax ferrireducens]|uniref:DUF1173 family protein n=1 Tax=Rhodoferax ferrireducens TaxID=192843 RepID=UPI000E0D3EBC|nr:DUF1173 family protein [Rhodoferax ferrireducens]
MDIQRFCIKGSVFGADDPKLQGALAQVHETPERPRCLCVPGGVEMYVAHHRQFVVKRMPETGSQHHPGCPSYEPELQQSGLGELLGEAVLESEVGTVELRVDFPWTRTTGRGVPRGEPQDASEIEVPRRRMSLRALMHFLFERADFNRWSPAMEGKRNQGVLHKYLQEAAEGIVVKGVVLAERLYVPEPFSEAGKTAVAQRRREKLAVLRPREGQSPLAVVIGEFKASEVTPLGRRVWIKHMPDAPLLMAAKAWERIERVFAPLLEARDADGGQKVRLMLVALIRARREHTYEIDVASLMLASEHWIPVEGIHELPLVQALVDQQRRFVKPLRYDARNAASFPNALLLDAGASPVPLHVVSAYLDPKEQAAKALALRAGDDKQWVWHTSESMPKLPVRARP